MRALQKYESSKYLKSLVIWAKGIWVYRGGRVSRIEKAMQTAAVRHIWGPVPFPVLIKNRSTQSPVKTSPQ